MSTKIVSVLGGVVQDLTTITDRIPDAGETVNALSFTMQAGGKGANSAVAVHRLTRPNPKNQPSDVVLENDIKVRMVGAVGDDQFGPALRQTLADCGVNVEGVRMIAGQATGVGNIIVEAESGANRIMQFPGAAWAVQPADFLTLESLGGGVVPDLVIAQLEIKRESIEQAIETAYEQGVEFLLNPSPAYCLMPELYRGITHLVVNETEAMMMSGCELQDLETHAGLTSVAEYFTKLGTKNVVITLGKKGAFFHNETTTGWIEAEKDCIVLDTSGAGYVPSSARSRLVHLC